MLTWITDDTGIYIYLLCKCWTDQNYWCSIDKESIPAGECHCYQKVTHFCILIFQSIHTTLFFCLCGFLVQIHVSFNFLKWIIHICLIKMYHKYKTIDNQSCLLIWILVYLNIYDVWLLNSSRFRGHHGCSCRGHQVLHVQEVFTNRNRSTASPRNIKIANQSRFSFWSVRLFNFSEIIVKTYSEAK